MAFIDGRPATAEDLAALGLTNYGHYTSMLVTDGRVRGLGLHLERLVRDCRAVFGADLDPGRVRAYAGAAARAGSGTFVVRVTVYDPAIGLATTHRRGEPHVLVTVRPAGGTDAPPLRVRPVPFQRDVPEVKHTGLFGPLHARREARLAGYDDALFVDPAGHVSEGTTWNVGLYDGRDVVWPEAGVLPGVTMTLLQRAHPYVVRPVPAELRNVEAVFATNSSFGVRPIARVGEAAFPAVHPIMDELSAAYLALPLDPLDPPD
ncbi:aminotransferase class IV [Streptomyces avicenniae]|uniref:aminotransferase class IV n=1 Tax=Streptomyces avicenniae TaxID=500153 RepID=UPI00069A06E8|nr:aminotransferase class IV [Streptomyces avicenniae]